MSTKKIISVPTGEEMMCTNMEPTLGQCHFFVSRKNRFCKMTVREGRQFCGEHSNVVPNQGEEHILRVPCPLDNKHSCCIRMLQKHLKKCNARLDVHPEYVVRDINRGPNTESCVKQTLSTVEDDILSQIINKVITAEFPSTIATEVKSHPLLEGELSHEKYGPSTLKHLIQNSSLLGHLSVLNVFSPGTCFIEFGAGRGQLSYWIGEVMAQKNSPCLLVPVDRASNRHKFDNKLRTLDRILVHRLRVDIADLCLAKVPQVTTAHSVVAVCKHLCGVATDLALRCLTNANLNNLKAILMTPCCHHRVEWESYVGQETFLSMGFMKEEFAIISSLASWGTCGQSNFNRGASLKSTASCSNRIYKFSWRHHHLEGGVLLLINKFRCRRHHHSEDGRQPLTHQILSPSPQKRQAEPALHPPKRSRRQLIIAMKECHKITRQTAKEIYGDAEGATFIVVQVSSKFVAGHPAKVRAFQGVLTSKIY